MKPIILKQKKIKNSFISKQNIIYILCTVYFYLLCMYENNNMGQENALK